MEFGSQMEFFFWVFFSEIKKIDNFPREYIYIYIFVIVNNSIIQGEARDLYKCITNPITSSSLFGIACKIEYANKKYDSGLICVGAFIGFAILKLSGSDKDDMEIEN